MSPFPPSIVTIVILVVLNVPLYVLIGWLLFDSWSGLLGDLDRAISPILAWFRGDWDEAFYGGWWAQAKLDAFVVACTGVIFLEYQLVSRFLLN